MKNSAKFIFALLYLFIPFTSAQEAPPSVDIPTLTVDLIMQDSKWIGEVQDDIYWSEDSKQVYFKWNPGDAEAESLYVVNRDGSGLRKLTLEERKNLIPERGKYNKDKTKKVYTKNSDIFLLDIPTMEVKQITSTTENESSPNFSFDETEILFVRNSNLFSINLTKSNIKLFPVSFGNSIV